MDSPSLLCGRDRTIACFTVTCSILWNGTLTRRHLPDIAEIYSKFILRFAPFTAREKEDETGWDVLKAYVQCDLSSEGLQGPSRATGPSITDHAQTGEPSSAPWPCLTSSRPSSRRSWATVRHPGVGPPLPAKMCQGRSLDQVSNLYLSDADGVMTSD